MKPDTPVRFIAGNSNRPFAEAMARRISVYRGESVKLADCKVRRFNDGEIFVEIFDNVRNEEVFIIQSTSRPANDNLNGAVDHDRRAAPRFGQADHRRDALFRAMRGRIAKTSARTPISAKLTANLITQAGVDRVLTMDLHAGQIQGFFDIPVDNLYAAPVFALDVKHQFKDLSDVLIVSPDVGGVARARELAKRIGAGLAIVDKRRGATGRDRIDDCDRRCQRQALHHRRRHRRHGGHALQSGRKTLGKKGRPRCTPISRMAFSRTRRLSGCRIR